MPMRTRCTSKSAAVSSLIVPTLRVGTHPVTLRVTLAQGLDAALAHFQNLEAQMLVIAYCLGPHHLGIRFKTPERGVL